VFNTALLATVENMKEKGGARRLSL
jgi:hypothetical protein